MIKKVKGGHVATSESGRRLSKRVKTKKGAIEQLYAVEMSQARRASRSGAVSKRKRRKVSRETYGRHA